MRRNGFVLLETIIAIGVAMIVLPGIVMSWVSVQRNFTSLVVSMQAHTELLYGASMVVQTVREASSVRSVSDGISVVIPTAVVTFRVRDGQLRREQVSGGKASVAILVRMAGIRSLSVSTLGAGMVRLRFVGSHETVVQDVWASQAR